MTDLLALLDTVSARVLACARVETSWSLPLCACVDVLTPIWLTHAARTPAPVLQCECLNADDSHPLRNALAEECRDEAGAVLSSDVDEGTCVCVSRV
jgi:hypothetical protein